MAIPRALRYDLTKYRKHSKLTLDRSEHGVPYATYRKSRRHVSGIPRTPRQTGYHNNLYNGGMPRSYHPSLNAPAVQVDEYDSYEPLGTHRISRPDNPRFPHSFNNHNQEMLFPISLPEDDLTQTEQFLMAMGKRDETEQVVLEEPFLNINENISEVPARDSTQLPVELQSVDELPSLEVLKETFVQLQETLPEDHPDLINVRAAMHKVRDHQISLSEMDETETEAANSYNIDAGLKSDPFHLDPYKEAEQFFDQQMTVLEKSFDTPAMELVEGQDMDFEIIPDETLPDDSIIQEQTLEQIIEGPFEASAPGFMEQDMMPDEMAADMSMPSAMPEPVGYDAGMAADEINHAMDQAAEQQMTQEPEPCPFQPQYGPFMAPEYMVDPQMQCMPNHMMPGPAPFGSAMPCPMPGM